MDTHMSYDDQKRLVIKGLIILGTITIVEVLIALTAKGHLLSGVEFTGAMHYVYVVFMIGFSLYKAYFIVYFFMHMANEVKGLRWSVLLPTLLLVWVIISFFNEGNAWGRSREKIKERDSRQIEQKAPSTGSLDYDEATTKMLL